MNLYAGGLPRIEARHVTSGQFQKMLTQHWASIVSMQGRGLLTGQRSATEELLSEELPLETEELREAIAKYADQPKARFESTRNKVMTFVQSEDGDGRLRIMAAQIPLSPVRISSLPDITEDETQEDLLTLTRSDMQKRIDTLLKYVQGCSEEQRSRVTERMAYHILRHGPIKYSPQPDFTSPIQMESRLLSELPAPIQDAYESSSQSPVTESLLKQLIQAPFFRTHFGKSLADRLITDKEESSAASPVSNTRTVTICGGNQAALIRSSCIFICCLLAGAIAKGLSEQRRTRRLFKSFVVDSLHGSDQCFAA